MTDTINPKELESELQHFSGTKDYYQNNAFMRNLYNTDGIQYLIKKAHAYWLIDAIASHFTKRKVRAEKFQVWKLIVGSNRAAILKCTDGDKGNGEIEICRQFIPYTDFPLPEIKIFVEYGSLDGENPAWIAMLPSER